MSAPIILALINGFLGAGKTTLIGAAARQLIARGLKVAVITNDQAEDLVDSFRLRGQGLEVAEVAGGCFCCQFDGLMGALDEVLARGARPDVVLAEAVGSCTDVSATVVQPLKDLHADRVRLAPFTVLVDATLGAEDRLGGDVLYIFERQVAEADLLVLNKTDLLAPGEEATLSAELAQRRPGVPLIAASARSGRGVEAWADALLGGGAAGTRVVEVDYDRYADGEAELGWLNARIEISGAPEGWRTWAVGLLEGLRKACAARKAAIAHLKIAVVVPGASVIVGIPDETAEPSVTETGRADPAAQAAAVLNARVRIAPEDLRALVEGLVAGADGRARILDLAAFRPGRPDPKHRYTCPVS